MTTSDIKDQEESSTVVNEASNDLEEDITGKRQPEIEREGSVEIEINFQLDANGRTTTPHSSEQPLEYSTRIYETQFVDPQNQHVDPKKDPSQLYKELLFDCEVADCGLMPRTFWVPFDFEPRCTLEHMAKDVLDFYTAGMELATSAVVGAEWWVQIRPSPERTGRYAMHCKEDTTAASKGIDFHWDKDEELRIVCGGSTYVHPHWSTVTYLSADAHGTGAPTLVAEQKRVDNLTGEWIDENETDGGDVIISWPDPGKHLCFDGRWLHGAPSNLAASSPCTENNNERRTTFLVNIWLHHQPLHVHPFPADMLSKMSGYAQAAKPECRPRLRMRLVEDTMVIPTVAADLSTTPTECKQESSYNWPLGDDGDSITMTTAQPVQQLLQNYNSTATAATTLRLRWPKRLSSGLNLWRSKQKRIRIDLEDTRADGSGK